MASRVRLWAREDGVDENQPKAIALEATRGPGPGRVFDVLGARTATEARQVLAVFRGAEPDEQQDGESWLAWRAARRNVQEVTS